ncbi:MAG: histidine kinase, partial [Photobacterium aquimaris]|nr:histidine kinase [Photobacterium aquimaris]
ELDDALFRYSNKLYQYHEVKADDLESQDVKKHDSKSKSESLPKPDLRNKDNTEELLVTLYVALEDNNLELIQFALESLRAHVEPMNNAELTEQVDKALEQVSLGAPPTQDVINIITVNLPMA